MLLLVILTIIGIYAVDISTTDLDISLHYKIGTITRNVAESGAYVGIDVITSYSIHYTKLYECSGSAGSWSR